MSLRSTSLMTKRKLLLIGVDQAIPYLIDKFLKDDVMPNLAKLVERGVKGEAFSCIPTDTPTNWTTIATGANVEKHGVTSFYLHLPGEPLDKGLEQKNRSRSQLSRFCTAEYIWDVVDRAGLRH
jgi:predicted AlkP superfamily phosphohydrolase/phosphomutase